MTVNGRTLGENIAEALRFTTTMLSVRTETAIYEGGATAVLTGNLAPRGCVIKPSAVEPRLRKHRGPAIVFEDYNHMMAEIDRDDLDVTPDHVMVLKNAGPKGGPGMPEWGMLPIPHQAREAGRARHAARLRRAHESGRAMARVSCTSRPRVSSAGRWRWSRPATRSK
jgi:dihydroxyacid dehydratase/phosphogluconate dehydratase